MNTAKVAISLIALGMFGMALAQEEPRVKLEFITDEGADEAVHLQFDSDELGFNLHDMQVGENQAIVDEQGRTVLVTREEDGFTFNVDGKTISMPALHAGHGDVMVMHGDHDTNVEVEVLHELTEADGAHKDHHQVKVVKKIEVVSD